VHAHPPVEGVQKPDVRIFKAWPEDDLGGVQQESLETGLLGLYSAPSCSNSLLSRAICRSSRGRTINASIAFVLSFFVASFPFVRRFNPQIYHFVALLV